jgi:hypothetical protein
MTGPSWKTIRLRTDYEVAEAMSELCFFEYSQMSLAVSGTDTQGTPANPSPAAGTYVPAGLARRGITESEYRVLRWAAVDGGYTTTDSPPESEFRVLALIALDACRELAAGTTTLDDLIEDDISVGAPPSKASQSWQVVEAHICA